MTKLSTLVDEGTVREYRSSGPAKLVNHTLIIDMRSISISDSINSRSGQPAKSVTFTAHDVTDDKQISFMTQSLSLVDQVINQFLPYADEIGDELEVTLVGEPSQKEPSRMVYHFE